MSQHLLNIFLSIIGAKNILFEISLLFIVLYQSGYKKKIGFLLYILKILSVNFFLLRIALLRSPSDKVPFNFPFSSTTTKFFSADLPICFRALIIVDDAFMLNASYSNIYKH